MVAEAVDHRFRMSRVALFYYTGELWIEVLRARIPDSSGI
jgi:hypothetical protein